MYNDPEWASEQEWDGYAWFGFAVSEAQVIEMQLQVIATALEMKAEANDDRESRWFMLYDRLSRLTLGQLLAKVKHHGVLHPKVIQMLDEVKNRRNTLAHLFFRPPEAPAGSSAAMAAIGIKYLQEAASLFSHVSMCIEPAVHEIVAKLRVPCGEEEARDAQKSIDSCHACP